jgi:hypothetical protein
LLNGSEFYYWVKNLSTVTIQKVNANETLLPSSFFTTACWTLFEGFKVKIL